MIAFDEYQTYDAYGLARLVKQGDVSPAELLDTAVARMKAVNPSLNAIVNTFVDSARQRISRPFEDTPFQGVPFLLKDLLDDMAGEVTTMGSHFEWRPEQDAERVSRYKSAGLVPFGKTSSSELGMSISVETRAHGPCHNPWQLGYSAGGSSGGSASAVAAGIVPMASASDGGGSIRIPASCCGLFGLKPSRGRTPVGPALAEEWSGASQGHVITRSVRDSAIMLDCLSGPEPAGLYHVTDNTTSFFDALTDEPAKLRIGVCRHPFIDSRTRSNQPHISETAEAALNDAIDLLKGLGHEVEEADPMIEGSEFWRWYITLVSANIDQQLQWIKQHIGNASAAKTEPAIRAIAKLGRSISASDFVAAKEGLHGYARAMADYFQGFDLMLTPTLVDPTPKHGVIPGSTLDNLGLELFARLPGSKKLLTSQQVKQQTMPTIRNMCFTVLANVTGLPSMSVPLYWDKHNMPFGVMFTGAMLDEKRLLQLAAQLERARPWFDKRPTNVAG